MSDASSFSIEERFERLPFTRYQAWLAAILGTCFAVDAVDVVMLSFLLAPITQDLGLTTNQAGVAGSAVFAGVGVGATVAGILTDKIGRRSILVYTMVMWGIGSLLTAFAWDLTSFAIFRFITGIGLGAELPAAFCLVAEFMPSDRRARITGLMHVGSLSAIVVFNLFSYAMVSRLGPSVGWRVMFVFMFIASLFALYVRRSLPESPRWLEATGRKAKALGVMALFERSVERAARKPLPSPTTMPTVEPATTTQSFRMLVAPGLVGRTMFS